MNTDDELDIDIHYTKVKVPVRITVGGKTYPIHQWNIKVVNKYWDTLNKSELDNLKDFALDFGS